MELGSLMTEPVMVDPRGLEISGNFFPVFIQDFGEVYNVYRPLCFSICEQPKGPSLVIDFFINFNGYFGTFVFHL